MISAVVLTWNSRPYVERCLKSLTQDAHRSGIELEVLVVDGGSSDGTTEILLNLAGSIPRLRVIQLGKNVGTTVSRNIAIREAQGDSILVLDSDTEVLPGALKALRRVLEEAPGAGLVAPRLLYADGSVQPSCKRFPNLPLKICKFLPVPLLQRLGEKAELYPEYIYSGGFKGVAPVDHCISACWLVRRAAMEEVGLLDERIFYAPEDVDYCLRMWLAGWEVLYVSFAEVVHYTQRLSHRSLRMAWVHLKGLLYYFGKHRYWISRRGVYLRIVRAVNRQGIQPPLSATCTART